jgi:polyphosphate kinase
VISSRYTDRELSWLDFNLRVLELAEDRELPLLERVRFLAIFASNLDEFYMVRVATLKELIAGGVAIRNSAGFTPEQLLSEVVAKAKLLAERHSDLFHREIKQSLNQLGIHIVGWKELDLQELNHVRSLFTEKIFPVLTPLAVDP